MRWSASWRWHCSASFSASARFALASSMVSPCEIVAGISPRPHPRHDVVQALDRGRGSAQTVEALAALARVDGLAQRRVLQKVCLLDVNRRAGARPIFLDGDSGPALDGIQLLRANLLRHPHLHHVPRFAPLDQTQSALGYESA